MSIATKIHRIGSSPVQLRMILCHASGFCKEIWDPFVEDLGKMLSKSNVSARIVAFDFTGHGDSRDYGTTSTPNYWPSFCPRDVWEVLDSLPADERRAPLVGVGHSMGGAGTIMSALARPGSFSQLFLCEPIVPEYKNEQYTKMFLLHTRGLVESALRRKSHWRDMDVANAYFHSRPLFSKWDPRSLTAYIHGGTRVTSHGVELKCKPELEAKLYQSPHEIFDQVKQVTCPVYILAQPSAETPHYTALAHQFPHGHYNAINGTHFWPMEKPGEFAKFVFDHLSYKHPTATHPSSSSKL